MRVRAKILLYIDGRARRPGEVFDYSGPRRKHLEIVPADAPLTPNPMPAPRGLPPKPVPVLPPQPALAQAIDDLTS